MLWNFMLLLGGFAVLVVAGDRVVGLASAVAAKARLTPAVIGLTVVAAGTSLPELFVSLTAALQGSPDISIGNVVGSNISNIALILGIAAAVAPIPIDRNILKLDYPFMVLATWVAFLLFRDYALDRLEAGFFAAAMIAYTSYSVWLARRQVTAKEAEQLGELVPDEAAGWAKKPYWMLALALAGGFVGLGIGAQLLVKGAVGLATAFGISERVIGVTVVAFGTSVPELAASLAAAFKKEHGMAVANIVGSNVFNLLWILGLTGLVHPIPINPGIVNIDCWVMVGITALLFPVMLNGKKIDRVEGGTMLVLYLIYVGYLIRFG